MKVRLDATVRFGPKALAAIRQATGKKVNQELVRRFVLEHGLNALAETESVDVVKSNVSFEDEVPPSNKGDDAETAAPLVVKEEAPQEQKEAA